jgi:U3 small nucleolar RNA-associated protein 13
MCIQLMDASSGSVTSTLAGDTEPVTALAFCPSGNRLYGASRSLQQRCWDVSNNAVARSWKGHKGPVLALAVDPSGGLLASASADRSCCVWDTDGFYCTHAFHGHRCPTEAALFPARLPVQASSRHEMHRQGGCLRVTGMPFPMA